MPCGTSSTAAFWVRACVRSKYKGMSIEVTILQQYVGCQAHRRGALLFCPSPSVSQHYKRRCWKASVLHLAGIASSVHCTSMLVLLT